MEPFGGEKEENTCKPKRLGCADPVEETKYLNTTALHQMWFDSKTKHREATKKATKIHNSPGIVKRRAEKG